MSEAEPLPAQSTLGSTSTAPSAQASTVGTANAASRPILDPVAVAAAERRLLRSAASADVGWLARQVAERMAERLLLIKAQPSVVIDASGWLGAGASVLRATYPAARIVIAERHAEALCRHAPASVGRRWWAPWRDNASTVEPLAPGEPWPAAVGLVWSNLDLHSRLDPPAELARWHRSVAVGGFVMFSCLGPATCRELTEIHAELGFGPATIPFVDMHDHGDMLVQAGFADPVMDQEQIRLTWPNADAALRDLRAIGANAHPARWPALRTPAWRSRLVAALEARADADGRVGLTAEIAYGHAFRIERPQRQPSESTISVEALRETARTFPKPA